MGLGVRIVLGSGTVHVLGCRSWGETGGGDREGRGGGLPAGRWMHACCCPTSKRRQTSPVMVWGSESGCKVFGLGVFGQRF